MILDVHMHYHKQSGQWEIELRKLGGRIQIARFAADCPRSYIDVIAKNWSEFLGVILVLDNPEEVKNGSDSSKVQCGG